jgi:hypothetical protein
MSAEGMVPAATRGAAGRLTRHAVSRAIRGSPGSRKRRAAVTRGDRGATVRVRAANPSIRLMAGGAGRMAGDRAAAACTPAPAADGAVRGASASGR